MVFYVINRTGAPLQITFDKIWKPEKPNGWQISVTAKPLTSGVHAASFLLKNATPFAVRQVSETPDPLHVSLGVKVVYRYLLDRDGDLQFLIESFLQ